MPCQAPSIVPKTRPVLLGLNVCINHYGHTTWRAIRSPAIHLAFYIGIILWETLSALPGWAGAIALFRARRDSPAVFAAGKRTGIAFTRAYFLSSTSTASIGLSLTFSGR